MIQHRRDIDGLRALAILAVVVFHMAPKILPSGFIGVDIFFVISGYLITSIIFHDLQANRFSFLNFYVKRVVRIFPSLLLMLSLVLLMGYCFLLPHEWSNLGKHIALGSMFVANYNLFYEVNYFNVSADLKPLLHLWSLGVEEQFYFLYPILLAWCWKKKKNLFKFILPIILISFVWNVLRVVKHPDEIFFLPHARFWQLMMGGLLALTPSQRYKKQPEIQSILGLVFFVIALVFINSKSYFPGWWAILPTMGAVLVISAGNETWVNKNIFGHKIMNYIGLISYPLYLWHWPLLSFSQIIYKGESPLEVKVVMIAISVILSILTYHLIESPVKKLTFFKKKRLSIFLLIGLSAFALIGVLQFYGVFKSYSSTLGVSFISDAVNDWDFPGRTKKIKGKIASYYEQGENKSVTLFLGDSNMEQYYPRMDYLLSEYPDKARKIIFFTTGGCPPIPHVRDHRPKMASCPQVVEKALEMANKKEIHTIVIAASWLGYFNYDGDEYVIRAGSEFLPLKYPGPGYQRSLSKLEEILQRFHDQGKKIILILNIPRGLEYHPKSMLERNFSFEPFKVIQTQFDLKRFLNENGAIYEDLKKLGERTKTEVINPLDILCHDDICDTTTRDGAPIYIDTHHLRAKFVREHIKFLDKAILD